MQRWIKSSLRRFKSDRSTSIINVFGLTLGMTVFLLIFVYVKHEFSYDNFHVDADRVFRLIKENPPGENNYQGIAKQSVLPAPLHAVLKNETKGITHAARMATRSTLVVETEGKTFYEDDYDAADADLFSILTFDALDGNASLALQKPYTVAISESIARKYFGTTDAVGKVLELTSFKSLGSYTVDLVYEDFPTHSSFQFNIIVRFEDFVNAVQPSDLVTWFNYNYAYLVKTEKNTKPADVEEQIRAFFVKRSKAAGNNNNVESYYWLQPLGDIYLGPDINFSNLPKNDLNRLYILSTIAGFVLLVAGINYVNLATARSVKRAKEVGIRKVSGASRTNLVWQFLSDSLAVCTVSMILACVIGFSLMPGYRTFIGKEIPFDLGHDVWMLGSIVGIPVVLALLAGVYPALVMSSFQPVKVMKGYFLSSAEGSLLRDGLTVFQFVVSGVLIFSVFVIARQLHFIQTNNPGYDREQILRLSLADAGVREKKEVFAETLRKYPNIASVSITSYFPDAIRTQQEREWSGPKGTSNVAFYTVFADEHYVDLFNIKLVDGRNFSPANPADRHAFLINETAANTFGWDNPVGMQFTGETGGIGDTVTIIGVIKDMHISSYRSPIKPFRIGYMTSWSSTVAIKIEPRDIAGTLSFIEETYKNLSTTKIPYSISFFDEEFGRAYKSDQQLGILINVFSAIAALVACLGLYGLSVHNVSLKLKEVSIRKIHGASLQQLVVLLGRKFIALVVVAFLIAAPVSYYFMNEWLAGFAYHIAIEPLSFILTVIVMVLIAVVTVGSQTWRAATVNPTVILRGE